MALIKKKTFLFVRNITSKLYHIPFIECHCLPAYRSNNADIFLQELDHAMLLYQYFFILIDKKRVSGRPIIQLAEMNYIRLVCFASQSEMSKREPNLKKLLRPRLVAELF